MSYVLAQRPVDAFFRPRPTTPADCLAVLTVAARTALSEAPDGLTLVALAERLVATASERYDAVRALEPAVAWLCPGRGWRCRMRSERELQLIAANDNAPRSGQHRQPVKEVAGDRPTIAAGHLRFLPNGGTRNAICSAFYSIHIDQ